MTVGDRELVARAIEGYEPNSSPYLLTKTDANRIASRAIAALTETGRLLPALPEGWQVSRVFEIKGAPVTTYCAIVYRPHRDGWWAKSGQGTGPTIPLALADALANGGDDGE